MDLEKGQQLVLLSIRHIEEVYDYMAAIITNAWKNAVLNRAYKDTPDNNAPSHFLVGAGTSTATAADTNLQKPLPKSATTIDACDATAGWSQGGDGSAVALNSTSGEYKQGTGCLNLPLTFATGLANWDKTIGAINLTNQYIYLWFYVSAKATYLDAGGSFAVRIELGTGGYVNVNRYDTTYANISDGWNLLVFAASAFTSQSGAGATITSIDRIRIQLDVIATAAGNAIRMDYWHYASLTEQSIAITSGYPTFDTGNKRVTLRGVLEATDANAGYVISEISARNDDSSFVLVGRDNVSPTISKTDKVRVVITWKDRLT